MERVVYLTAEQAEELKGVEYTQGVYFNPVQDEKGWFISTVEQEMCSIAWVKEITPETMFRYTIGEVMKRQSIFHQISNHCESVSVNEQFIQLYDDNTTVFNQWISGGGDGLKDLFESADGDWLEVEDSEGVTVRGFVLNLL